VKINLRDEGPMTIITCLVGTHFRRPFDGIRYWSKRRGITRIYLLYSEADTEDETAVFSYMSRRNAEELRDRLEIMEPIMVGYDPMDNRDAFRAIYGILSRARGDGEEVLIDITSTTNITQGVALTIALMFRNARVYTVPSKQPAWYVSGRIGDEKFEKWFKTPGTSRAWSRSRSVCRATGLSPTASTRRGSGRWRGGLWGCSGSTAGAPARSAISSAGSATGPRARR